MQGSGQRGPEWRSNVLYTKFHISYGTYVKNMEHPGWQRWSGIFACHPPLLTMVSLCLCVCAGEQPIDCSCHGEDGTSCKKPHILVVQKDRAEGFYGITSSSVFLYLNGMQPQSKKVETLY